MLEKYIQWRHQLKSLSLMSQCRLKAKTCWGGKDWVLYTVKALTSDKETVSTPYTQMEGLRADGIFKSVPFPVLLGWKVQLAGKRQHSGFIMGRNRWKYNNSRYTSQLKIYLPFCIKDRKEPSVIWKISILGGLNFWLVVLTKYQDKVWIVLHTKIPQHFFSKIFEYFGSLCLLT